jgi:hypothetical protein
VNERGPWGGSEHVITAGWSRKALSVSSWTILTSTDWLREEGVGGSSEDDSESSRERLRAMFGGG